MSVMLGVLTGMQTWGGGIGTVLQEWEMIGVFEYALPFLLVFAIVFAILMSIKVLGENKGINMVIALAVGMMAITSYDFRNFVRIIMPKAGIALMVLLVCLILVGLFINVSASPGNWIFFGIAAFASLVVVLTALSSYEVFGGGAWWWSQYGSAIIAGAIVVGLILLVVLPKKKTGP